MFLNFLTPPPATNRIANDKIDEVYKKYRREVFLGIFVGYATYYLLRKNFSLAIPYLTSEQGYTKGQMGLVLAAVSIAYGLSKLFMGNLSDRSNAKRFLTMGLVLSAVINIVFGFIPVLMSSVWIMFLCMFANGWAQGMGWPACGRTMVHWFNIEERGTKMAIWNVAHNIGGGLIGILAILGLSLFMQDWKSLFYFPAIIALLISIPVYKWMQDTPQSVGLPAIEEYMPLEHKHSHDSEEEMSAKEIFFNHVLNNKFLWYIACANIFVYLVRYGVIDWAPTYLTEMKNFSQNESRLAYFLYEYAGIPGTILCGYISDKIWHGQRSQAGILYMIGVTIALLFYWLTPAGHHIIHSIALISIGFLIYGPVMLIGVQALDLAHKKAAGTAAGLTGLFGYLGGAVFANISLGYLVDKFGWQGGFILLLAACLLAIFFLALTLPAKK